MLFRPFGKREKETAVPCQNSPLPIYLKPFLVLDQAKCSMHELAADIRCTCGCMTFHAYQSEDIGFLFRLECSACGREFTLFDAQQHGWDAIVCGAAPEKTTATECKETCRKCGGEAFHTRVWIEPCQKEEYTEDVPEGRSEDEWVNAFTWFGAHLTCAGCGRRIRDWADVETA